MNHPFLELESEYARYLSIMRVRPECERLVDLVARRLTKPSVLANYADVEHDTGIPQVVQAAICEREDGSDFTKNPGQGDPLTEPSIHVPRGRPPLGAPPNDHFPVSWKFAAIDAFTVCDQLNVISAPWSMPYACWKWEGYNGFAYRARGLPSPYVFGGTNIQRPGKYVRDHVFDPTVTDSQIGCAPIAMKMIELVPSLSFGQAVQLVEAPLIIPDPKPVPAAVGGGVIAGLSGARWIQTSLNLIEHLDPPLKVDGSYGRMTRSAVREAQAKFGLPQNGLVDDALCTAIDGALAAISSTT